MSEEGKPNWCFVDGKVPIFIDRSDDAKFPILTNGRRYKKDSRVWLHKNSTNRGKNGKKSGDEEEKPGFKSPVTSLGNDSDNTDIPKESGASSSAPITFSENDSDDMDDPHEEKSRLSLLSFSGTNDQELAPNTNQILTRSYFNRMDTTRRLRKRRLVSFHERSHAILDERRSVRFKEEGVQHELWLDNYSFRPIEEEEGLEDMRAGLVDGHCHGDINGHSLAISTSFWFDTVRFEKRKYKQKSDQ